MNMDGFFFYMKDGESIIIRGSRDEVVDYFYNHDHACGVKSLFTTKIVNGKIVHDTQIAVVDNR